MGHLNQVSKYVVLISIDGMANYYLQEKELRMPNLRQLMRQGVSASGMESIFPTATWAIHTSMVTGTYPRKSGVLGNWVVDRTSRRVGEHFGDRTWAKHEVVLRETIYDAAKRMGWTTASICWPETREAAIDFNIPEFYEQELFEQYATPSLWKELKEAGLPIENYAVWSKDHGRGQMRDWLTTEVAKHVIEKHQPNLLMLHYLLPDSYQHDYGVRSKEVFWSLEYIDERIGEVLAALKKAGVWEATDLFVVSDHGFVDTNASFFPNVLFKQMGWFNSDDPAQSKVMAVSNGGSGYVYILEEEEDEQEQLLREVRQLLQNQAGVGKLFESDQLVQLGLPAAGELEHHRPDFAFEAELDCFVHFDHTGEDVWVKQAKFMGMHGYLPHHDEMKAIFVAAGPSIQPGLKLPQVKVIDVAPTIAKLLGTELEDIDGQVLPIWKVNTRERVAE